MILATFSLSKTISTDFDMEITEEQYRRLEAGEDPDDVIDGFYEDALQALYDYGESNGDDDSFSYDYQNGWISDDDNEEYAEED